MRDQYGRDLTDLRISLTDRCNLRCVYCMPAEGIDFRPSEELLQDDELLLLVRVAAELGVRKVRLTGGEPTVRPGLVPLVREIHEELGIGIAVANEVFATTYSYPECRVELHFLRGEIDGNPTSRLGQEMRWVPREELAALPFPPADAELIRLLTTERAES